MESRDRKNPLLDQIWRMATLQQLRQMPDRELLAQFVGQHDETAFRVLMDRYGLMVLRVCKRILGNDQDAEDAYQATFVVLTSEVGAQRWPQSLEAWLHSVAVRIAFPLLTILMLSSCASAKRGVVHGKVSCGGRPIIYGLVVLIGADDMPVTGPINSDGTYAVSGVLAGAVRVAVVSPDPARPRLLDDELPGESDPKAKPTLPKYRPVAPEVDRSKWFPLPKQYELADTSGITTAIHGSDNTFDIELK